VAPETRDQIVYGWKRSVAARITLDTIAVEAIAVSPESVHRDELEELSRFVTESVPISESQTHRELVEEIHQRGLPRVLDFGFPERGKEAREGTTIVERAV
jgi:hypothetical protein